MQFPQIDRRFSGGRADEIITAVINVALNGLQLFALAVAVLYALRVFGVV